MYCTNCGKQFEGKFCPECGTPAVQTQSGSTSSGATSGVDAQIFSEKSKPDHSIPMQQPAEQNKKNVRKIAILVGIFVFCFGSYLSNGWGIVVSLFSALTVSLGCWGVYALLKIIKKVFNMCKKGTQTLCLDKISISKQLNHSDYINAEYESSNKNIETKDDVLEVSNKKSLAFICDSYSNRTTFRVAKIGSCIELYSYTKVPIENVDRNHIQWMCENDNWKCEVKENNGRIEIINNEHYVATLDRKGLNQMIFDWIRRGDPIRCELTGAVKGNEHVVLAFYRDEEKRFSHREKIVTKLINYSSEDRQGSFYLLEDGEKLTIQEDDYKDGVFNVLDYCDDPIGDLPVKYARIHEECPFGAIFVDHIDYDEEKEKYIPYVRIYK